jgi:hypothetical protein
VDASENDFPHQEHVGELEEKQKVTWTDGLISQDALFFFSPQMLSLLIPGAPSPPFPRTALLLSMLHLSVWISTSRSGLQVQ